MKSLRHLCAVVAPLLLVGFITGCSGLPHPTTKTLTSIAVTPATPANLKVGATQQFTATGTYSDSSTADITATVTWASGTTATATITASGGLATGVAAGTTQITATMGTVTSPGVTLTVTSLTLTSIAVTPATPAHLKVGATQQFTATGTYSDSSTADITATVTWASGTTATATITASGGLATGVAGGTTSITATLGTVTSPGVTLTVISLTSIAITPNPASVAVGSTIPFTATGTYSDASTSNITTQVTWSSLPIASATIVATTGVATGVANGTAQISAVLGGIVAPSVTLTVGAGGAPVPVAVKIEQTNPTIPVGGVEDFTAVALLSDGTTAALGTPATWSSSTTATATILATSGIASGVAAGTTTITASSGTLTSGTTLLSVVAAFSRFAFVGGENDVAASAYVINTAATTLTPNGTLRDTTKPIQVVPEPSGRFAYGIGANASGEVAIYTVDPVSGVLSKTGTVFDPGFSAPGPSQAVVDPTGRFLYIANDNTNDVAALQINTADGTLSCIGGVATPCPTSPAGSFPIGIAIDRLGKFVYATNINDNTVSGYLVSPNGSLSALAPPAPATFLTGAGPGFPAIDATNKYLYVPNSGDGTISAYQIDSTTGALTPVTGSPFAGPGGSGPTMAVSDPAGKFLYVTDENNNEVDAFQIAAPSATTPGALTLVSGTGGTLPTGNLPIGLAVDAGGGFIVVVNQSDDTLTYYSLNSSTGAMSAGRTVASRAVPQFVNLYNGTAAPVIAPATVEAANAGTSSDVSSYIVNPSTGALTAAPTSPTPTFAGNSQAFSSQTGKFFYTASAVAPSEVGAFSVSGAAALTAVGSPVPLSSGDNPAGIYADPSDQFVYVADSTANAIQNFTNSGGTFASNAGQPSLSGLGSVNGIAGDSQGLFMVALGTAQLQPLLIDAAAGGLSAGTPLTPAGTNFTAGAIDASGLFLVATDSTGHTANSFQITPVTSSASDGNLTAVGAGGSISAGTNGPYAVTFDPLNRFVFVADLATGKVTAFGFSPTSGALSAGTATIVNAGPITNVAVDATGTYLYVAIPGSSASTPSSVAAFKITAATGALTAIGSPIASGTLTGGVAVTNSVN